MFWFAGEFQKVCDDLHLASSTVSYLKAIAVASMALSISYAGAWLCRPTSSVGKLVGVGLGLAVVVMAVTSRCSGLAIKSGGVESPRSRAADRRRYGLGGASGWCGIVRGGATGGRCERLARS
jgi:hypothetical protein